MVFLHVIVTGTQRFCNNGCLPLRRDKKSIVMKRNKVYKDELYDYATKITDATKTSFTSNFFQLAANQNAVVGNWMAQTWNGIASILAISKQYPGIGAFPDGQDWTAGWANFDPQNAQY